MRMIRNIACLALVLSCLFLTVACSKSEDEIAEAGKNGGVAFYVEYNGAKITMGEDADKIIDALGEAQDRREIGDCGGLGAQVRYSYPSLEIYVLESKTDGNVIDQITFRDDLVTTPEGACICMSVEDATEFLGTPSVQNDKSIEYQKSNFVLKLGILDGVITEIDYITVAE